MKKDSLKVFLTLFPPLTVVGIFLMLLLRWKGNGSNNVLFTTSIVISFLLWFAFIRWALVVREIGKMLFARVFGGMPHHVILGTGKGLGEYEWLGVKVGINRKLTASASKAFFTSKPFLKFRYAMYLSGGFLLNVLLVIVSDRIIYYTISPSMTSATLAWWVWKTFAFASIYVYLLDFVASVRPNYGEDGFPSDQVTLFNLWTTPIEHLVDDFNEIYYRDAHDYFKRKNYSKAICLYKKLVNDEDETRRFNSMFNLGTIFLREAKFEKSIKMYESLEKMISVGDQAFLWHTRLAWNYLGLGESNLAEYHARQAFPLKQNGEGMNTLRGAVFIERGELNKAYPLLKEAADNSSNLEDRLLAAIFLYSCLSRQQSWQEAEKYRQFIEHYFAYLSVVNAFFWERVQKNVSLSKEE
ncbi:lipopolysaccharide assembly protein LapB [uncultured Microscilla sp.]|uniref:tetratricopeptide repeat protein n=1 Tax=uncultured Microscilla sp. TaxID=432653 RepID=UPI002630B743|nr:tetratricopeptide repeat protein [uncultured Microscilla sp.]